MVYLQLMFGLGVGLLGVGIAYFMFNRPGFHTPQTHNGHRFNRSSWDSDWNQRQSNSNPGDKCPVCREPMTPNDIRFLNCGHAMHQKCYDGFRRVDKYCPKCESKFAELSEEGDKCVICLEVMTKDDMEYMKCEHALHTSCLSEYREKRNHICPLCRNQI